MEDASHGDYDGPPRFDDYGPEEIPEAHLEGDTSHAPILRRR